jgi:hypothetical protein
VHAPVPTVNRPPRPPAQGTCFRSCSCCSTMTTSPFMSSIFLPSPASGYIHRCQQQPRTILTSLLSDSVLARCQAALPAQPCHASGLMEACALQRLAGGPTLPEGDESGCSPGAGHLCQLRPLRFQRIQFRLQRRHLKTTIESTGYGCCLGALDSTLSFEDTMPPVVCFSLRNQQRNLLEALRKCMPVPPLRWRQHVHGRRDPSLQPLRVAPPLFSPRF